MYNPKTLQKELTILQTKVIGLYKEDNITYMVMNHQKPNNTIDTLRITYVCTIQKEFDRPIRGQLELFPDNKNMKEMLDDVYGWMIFVTRFID